MTDERAPRSTSSVVRNRAPQLTLPRSPRAMVAGLFATLAAQVRRPADAFHEDATIAERPPTPLGRLWHTTRFGFLLVPLALVAGLLWVIWTRTARVPYWDEWEIIALDQKFKQGTLGLPDIVMLHATAHRIIIPRIIELTLINLTNLNRQIEMTFDVGLAVAAACLLFFSIRRTLGSLNAALALLAPLSLLFFSFAQFGNWFAPFQVAIILTSFGAICCVRGFATVPTNRKGLALAIVGALIGSMSILNGVLLWIAFLPGALFSGVRKAVIWIGCAVVVWVLYFQGFSHNPTRPGIRADISYSLTYLGGPVGYPSIPLAQSAALLSIVLLLGNVAVYWWRHRSVWRIAPWLQLALFVLGSTQATALGRVYIGNLQALSSRYQTLSVLWWIAVIVVTAVNIKDLVPDSKLPSRRAYVTRLSIMGVNLVSLLLITAGLIPVNVTGMQQALLWQDTQRQNQYAIRDYRTAPESCLELYFPWRDVLLPRVRFLEQQRLSVFSTADRSQPDAASPTAPCQKPYQQFIDNAAPLRAGREGGRAGLA